MKSSLFKRSLALVLSVLILTCNLPFVAFAAEGDGITVSSDVTAQDIEIDSDVAFTYYVEINKAPYNGTAQGSDLKNYTITDGLLVLPYDVSAVITDIPSGASYSIKRLAYDNDKYAYIGETAPQVGDMSAFEYYVSVNGGEKTKIDAETFNAATDNGTNLTVTEYKDADGNTYTEDEISEITGFAAERNEGVVTTYDMAEKTYQYVTSSLEEHTVKYDIEKSFTSSKKAFITTYTFSATANISADDIDLSGVETSDAAANGVSTTKGSARNSIVSNVKTSMTRLAYRVFTETINAQTGKTAVFANDVRN